MQLIGGIKCALRLERLQEDLSVDKGTVRLANTVSQFLLLLLLLMTLCFYCYSRCCHSCCRCRRRRWCCRCDGFDIL